MQTDCIRKSLEFHPLGRRKIVGRFDGGAISSDAGGLLLRECERATRIVRQFARCFTDHRDPEQIEHTVEELVAQRVYALALGYEDLNDHDALRLDPLLAALVGKLDPTGQEPEEEIGSGQGVGRQEHVEPAGADEGRGDLVGAVQEDRSESEGGGAVAGGVVSAGAFGRACGNRPRPGRDGRSDPRQPGGAVFSRLLRGILLPAAVHLLRGISSGGEAAAVEHRCELRGARGDRRGSWSRFGRSGRRCGFSCGRIRASAGSRSWPGAKRTAWITFSAWRGTPGWRRRSKENSRRRKGFSRRRISLRGCLPNSPIRPWTVGAERGG